MNDLPIGLFLNEQQNDQIKRDKLARQLQLNDWIIAVGKASSAIRFAASKDERYTQEARRELIGISETLNTLEVDLLLQLREVM